MADTPNILDFGSGAPVAAKYAVTAVDSTLTQEIVIPGLAGSPQKRVGGAFDDEFDTTSSAPPTGWTAVGSPATSNANTDALSFYHVKATAASGMAWVGIEKVGPSIPFTVDTYLADMYVAGANNRVGLGVGVAALGGAYAAVAVEQVGFGEWTVESALYTNRTTYSTGVASVSGQRRSPPLWLRIVVASASSVSYWYSFGGLIWWPVGSGNPGFTPGSIALLASADSASNAPEGMFDYIRCS